MQELGSSSSEGWEGFEGRKNRAKRKYAWVWLFEWMMLCLLAVQMYRSSERWLEEKGTFGWMVPYIIKCTQPLSRHTYYANLLCHVMKRPRPGSLGLTRSLSSMNKCLVCLAPVNGVVYLELYFAIQSSWVGMKMMDGSWLLVPTNAEECLVFDTLDEASWPFQTS